MSAAAEFEDVWGNPMVFVLPRCWKHRRNRWWCRKCHRVAAAEFEDTVHALWRLQGCELKWTGSAGGSPGDTPMSAALEWDNCAVCGKRMVLKINGALRSHGHPARRCSGSGKYGIDWLAFKADLAAHKPGGGS